MAWKSNPWCNRKRWSSLAITATGMCLEIWSRGTQWCRIFNSPCCTHRITINGVMYTGKKRYSTTARMVETKKNTMILRKKRPIMLIIQTKRGTSNSTPPQCFIIILVEFTVVSLLYHFRTCVQIHFYTAVLLTSSLGFVGSYRL